MEEGLNFKKNEEVQVNIGERKRRKDGAPVAKNEDKKANEELLED